MAAGRQARYILSMSGPILKICGLTTPDALTASLDAGADMVGFVFFSPSPRNLSLDQARQLAGEVDGRAQKVALTVDAGDAELERIIAAMAPDWLQLHGRETPESVARVRARFGLPVMKAIGLSVAGDLAHAAAYEAVADRLLFDAKPPPDAKLPGGNGLPFDWTLLLDRKDRDWMLSGGLTPQTVAEAIRLLDPPGIDVSSGVERAPGIKDPELIRRFIAQARGARQSLSTQQADAQAPRPGVTA